MNDPSAPTAPESPPQPTEKQGPSLSQTLLRTNQELRAAIVSNVIKKGLIGLGVGIGLGLFIFKRKSAPIMFSTGIGLGMAYSEGSQMVRDYHEGLRRRAAGDAGLGHHRNCHSPHLHCHHHQHERTPPGELN